jgi:class 3 adenylate cyclase/tetratricopeptide (TPR) repeat protein
MLDQEQLAALMRRGEVLAAYDIAHGALDAPERDGLAAYFAVLCLARAGALDFARSEYVRLGLHQADNHDAVALGARLLKDVALSAKGARRLAFAKASLHQYERLFRRYGGIYGAINAATMTLVSGDRLGAVARARTALAMPTPACLVAEGAYYDGASRAEALFLMGDLDAACEAMGRAVSLSPAAYAAHASTLRQFEMLCRETGADTAWLEPFRPPACAHFTGHILDPTGEALCGPALRRRVDEVLAAERIGFGYGGLAAGGDIIFAEALLAAGAELHVVLPVEQQSFIAVSVAPFGEAWVKRFERCLFQAASVRYASSDPYLGDEQVFAYSSQFAMGCAVLRAQTLSTKAVQLAIWDGHPGAGPAGVHSDLDYWSRSGRRRAVIEVERPRSPPRPTGESGDPRRAMKAMLFADIKGFGALRDDQIPIFVDAVMARLANVIEALPARPIHVETWGDGLFLVFDEPIDAALAALALLEAHRALDLRALGLPRTLGLRIGGHYGPVHLRTNPITKAAAVMGAHVVVAARIEPDVAPGSVCVSEALAGALATFHGDKVCCGYVGRTQGRKGFPATPIFSLTRAF